VFIGLRPETGENHVAQKKPRTAAFTIISAPQAAATGRPRSVQSTPGHLATVGRSAQSHASARPHKVARAAKGAAQRKNPNTPSTNQNVLWPAQTVSPISPSPPSAESRNNQAKGGGGGTQTCQLLPILRAQAGQLSASRAAEPRGAVSMWCPLCPSPLTAFGGLLLRPARGPCHCWASCNSAPVLPRGPIQLEACGAAPFAPKPTGTFTTADRSDPRGSPTGIQR